MIDLVTWLTLLFSGLTAMTLGHKDLGLALLGMALLSNQLAGHKR